MSRDAPIMTDLETGRIDETRATALAFISDASRHITVPGLKASIQQSALLLTKPGKAEYQ